MATLAEVVAQLHGALASNTREHDLVELIDRTLSELRVAYRKQPTAFTTATIAFLKELASIEESLREFIDTLGDKAWVRTRDDAEELASRFQGIAERLTPHLIAKRAEKEVRELVERSKTLPHAAVAIGNADHLRRVALLEQQAPVCGKCKDTKMVLRESQNGLFWGCRSFPQCFGRRWLTKKENALLSGDS